MMNRSRKILGLLLAFVMLISLLPGAALARAVEEERLEELYVYAAAEQEAESFAAIQPRSGPITVTNETQLRNAIRAGNSPITINTTIALTNSLSVHPSLSGGNFTLQGTGRLNVTGFFRHMDIHQNRHVTIGGSLTFGRPAGSTVNGGGIAIHEGATLTMNGGTITGNQGYVFGGGVDVSWGTFNFNGGTIHTNGASDGGGVFVGARSRLVMRGGVIRNNVASSHGGGVSSRGNFHMINGEIHTNNVTSATGGGGGVSISSISTPYAFFTMDGGAIRNNTADRGAGMRVSSSSSGATTVTINNGEIHNNISVRSGAGVWIMDTSATTTTFTMNNGAIRHNWMRENGDGGGMHISVSDNSAVRINGGEIRNNTATRNGGGIFTTSYTVLRTAAAVRFSANSAGARHDFGAENRGANVNVTRGGSGNPQHILWASVSRAGTHALNNYDVNFTHSNIVTFNLNGGTGNFPQQVLRDGQTVTQPVAIPVRAGHTFRGWFTAATGSTNFNFSAPITGNTTVHAQWVAYPVVTFNLQGGTGNIPPQTMTGGSGTATEPPVNPTREGHTFDGWFTTASGNTRFNFTNTITANTTVHARWIPYRTVTFNLNGGTGNFPTLTVPDGTIVAEPAVNPTRAEHTFSGWFTTATGTTRFNFAAATTANRTAHAQWIPYRTVTFNLHGGTGDFPTQAVPNGTIIAEPSTEPTQEGYTFLGWFTTATGTVRFNFNSPNTANRTAHARWTPTLPTDRTVTFNLHGGTGNFPLTQIVADGGTATAPATNPTRPNYNFVGWYTAATGGTRFNFSNPITANTTIHARWEPGISWTVTFVLYDSSPTVMVPDGTVVAEPARPIRPNFTFAGWYTAATGGELFNFSNPIIANTSIHARWTSDAVEVTFDSNGGAPMTPQIREVVIGDTYASAMSDIETPSREDDYVFIGWFTASVGGIRVLPSDSMMQTSDHTLYAHWEYSPGSGVDWAVTVVLHDGIGGSVTTMVPDGTVVVEPATPSRPNYTFAGWYTAVTGGEPFNFSNPIIADTIIYARWIPYRTVSFDLHGGLGDFPSQTMPNNNTATEPTTDPTRLNYNFIGWYTEATDGVRFDFSTPIIEDTTIHARWISDRDHIVTFNLHGGIGSFPLTQIVEDGETATEPEVEPTRTGYRFVGWYTAETGGVPFDFSSPITASTTIHAQWTVRNVLGGGGGGGSSPGSDYELHLAYMFGDSRGNFRPSADITRAEVATILARTQLLDFEQGISTLPSGMASFDAFSDVNPGQWFYYYVAWAYDAGLIQGHAGRFRPNDPVTREELAAMIARTGTVRPEGNTSFTDNGDISNWARSYVYTVYRDGLMVGSGGNFRPTANITRAETATAMNRILGRLDSRSAFYAADVVYLNYARPFPDVRGTTWYFPSVLAAANDHRLTRDSNGAIDWKAIVGVAR